MMKIYNSVLTDSPLASPFVPKKKNDASWAGNLFGGFLGGLLGLEAQGYQNENEYRIAEMNRDMQRETNEMNKQLVEAANKQNYQMFKEQNAFNLDMWNKQNQYNSPAAQVQRLKAAGINPAMALGQSTPASSISSAQGSPSQAAQMVAPRMDYHPSPYDFSFIGDSAGQAVNAYYDNQLKNEQAKKVAADGQISAINAQFQSQRNVLDMMKMRGEIDKLLSDKKLTDEQREYYESVKKQINQAIDLTQAQWKDLVVKESKNNALTDASTQNMLASAAAKRAESHLTNIIAKYQPQLMNAQISLTDSQGAAALQSVAVQIQEGRLKSAQAASQELQNQLFGDKASYLHSKEYLRNHPWIRDVLIGIDLSTETLFNNISFGMSKKW